jgi:16S rRNA (guanine527-N7)-methyltransferase
MTAPLVRAGGELVFMKGERVHEEIEAATSVIRKFHLQQVRVDVLAADDLTEQTRVFRATVERDVA